MPIAVMTTLVEGDNEFKGKDELTFKVGWIGLPPVHDLKLTTEAVACKVQ